MAKSKPKFSLKDQLFNKDRVVYLAGLFEAASADFDSKGFVKTTMKGLGKLELKERIVFISTVLEKYLSEDFKVAAKQIQASLPPPLDPSKTDDDFGDFIIAPLGEYVVRNGLSKKHLKLSLKLLHAITQRFSMEDAIRFFINAYPKETLAELKKWSTDKNYHVRRLVSEGTRPMLPWSKRLTIEPLSMIPFLDTLHSDPTRYVTRSVSNHLNDIAKTQPQLVIQKLKQWKKLGLQDPDELQWMTRHSLRTLVKQGHSQALRLLGFRANPKIQVTKVEINSPKIKFGEAVEFSFFLTASANESLMIDYIVDFVKANGKTSPKTYKIKQLNLSKGESTTISKRHLFRTDATTYTLYPGTHKVTLQINGKKFDSISFDLV